MKLIVCVEDRYGLLFNRRRVSRDRAVTDKIMSITDGNVLWMNTYSSPLFPPAVRVDEQYLEKAGEDDYCFLEDQDIQPYLSRVKELILLRWNRRYPSDFAFPFESFFQSWKLVSREDFPGNSHDMITMEVYRP